jgi:hypothetical protein
MRQEFVLKLLNQGFELSIEGVVKENDLSHGQIMILKAYGLKPILLDFILTFTVYLMAYGLR